jgi:hypothetical protein
MITFEEVRPGDTFVRRNASGDSELRRVLPDGTSALVKRLCGDGVPPQELNRSHDDPASPH